MAEFPSGTAGIPAGKDGAPSHKNGKRLAWLLLALSVALFAALLALESTACAFLFDQAQSAPAFAYGIFLVPINALAFSLLGALVITYRPQNRIGWVMLLFGLSFNLLMMFFSYGNCAVRGVLPLPLGVQVFWLGEVLSGVTATIGFVLLFMLFPDGLFLSPRWRRLAILLTVLLLFFALLRAFLPGPIGQTLGDAALENPFGLIPLDISGLSEIVDAANLLIFPVFALVGITSLVLRWRRSTGETRQQIKWIAYFVATAGVVLMAQSAFVAVTGQESPLAIVISTLVIAALFNPLRQRLQAFMDRRFYRRSYDAAQTLAQFAQTARDEVDLEQLTAELTRAWARR